ncbi:hypothetical protein L227DRAFT_609428 [Lentinus tigrinus ALCF2SS1-6]|uniref:Uncharacterized protein n=1 Tax=Lentinus tigrinus ALCF2SS1-6 TaxID=1328759 RepID=A0A5C2SHZ7_9APHY|nr:hypothetical protein L227DRAFT_609428 [Lentinus tigrinus ALCF2SS1-6]
MPNLCVDGAHLSMPSQPPTLTPLTAQPLLSHTHRLRRPHTYTPNVPSNSHPPHSHPSQHSHSSPTLSPCAVDTLFHTVTPPPSSTRSMLFSSSPQFTKPIPITPGTVFVLFLPHIMHSSHTTDPSQ